MDAEPFHEAEGARDGAVRHHPHDHVHALGRQADEVPEIVVRGLRLRKGAVGFRLHRVNHVGEADCVLDEEHRDIVADDVPVAFLGIELDREAAHVARQVHRALAAGDGGETDEGGRLLAGALEDVRARVARQRFVSLKETVRAIAAGMHHALRDALMVEVEDLFAEVEVLEQRRAAKAHLKRIEIVRDRPALRSGHHRNRAGRRLVQLSAGAAAGFLVVDFDSGLGGFGGLFLRCFGHGGSGGKGFGHAPPSRPGRGASRKPGPTAGVPALLERIRFIRRPAREDPPIGNEPLGATGSQGACSRCRFTHPEMHHGRSRSDCSY